MIFHFEFSEKTKSMMMRTAQEKIKNLGKFNINLKFSMNPNN